MNNLLNERVGDLIAHHEAAGVLAPGTGIAVSIVEGGSVRFTGTYGWRERDHCLPVTPQTLFEIGSLTKAFTATSLVMASDRGEIDLDRPINASAGLITLSDADASREISIADIIAHRTGLPSNDLLWYFRGLRSEELLTAVTHLELVPGAFKRSFIYNNLMYGVLGQLFGALVGESWETCVTRHILQPLDMASTGFNFSEPPPNLALPYVGGQRAQEVDATAIAAAGGLKSTLDDMTRWMQFHLEGGRNVRAERLLSDAAAMLMHSRQIAVERTDSIIFQGLEWLTPNAGYGFGWFIGSTRNMKVLFHPGFSYGFSTVLVLVPERRLGVLVMMNENLSAVPARLVEGLVAALLDPSSQNVARSAEAAPSARELSLVGTYNNPAYGAITVRIVRNCLVLNYAGNEWPLTRTGEQTAGCDVRAFGLKIPLSVEFTSNGCSSDQLLVALSLDPRVMPQAFVRSSN